MEQLDGPKILGTMDVSNMIPGGKHKRKRLEKEKVNVAKEGKSVDGKKDKSANKGGNNNNNAQRQQNNQQQGQQNQQQGLRRATNAPRVGCAVAF